MVWTVFRASFRRLASAFQTSATVASSPLPDHVHDLQLRLGKWGAIVCGVGHDRDSRRQITHSR